MEALGIYLGYVIKTYKVNYRGEPQLLLYV